MNESCPQARLTAVAGGYELNYVVLLTGDESEEQLAGAREAFLTSLEQARLMVQTLALVGFEAPQDRPFLERQGVNLWTPVELLQPAPEVSQAPEPAAVRHVHEVLNGNGHAAPEPEPEADPVLHAAIHGKAPTLTRGLAAALTAASPPEKRATLARALGSTAETVYLWMRERQDQSFTVGEVAKGTNHSDHIIAVRLKALEGAGLVRAGTRKATRGKHKDWVVYQALGDPTRESAPEPVRELAGK